MSDDGLFQLGMDLEARHHEGADASFADAYAFDVPRSTTHTEDNDITAPAANTPPVTEASSQAGSFTLQFTLTAVPLLTE